MGEGVIEKDSANKNVMINLEKMFEPYVCKGLISLICKEFQKTKGKQAHSFNI